MRRWPTLPVVVLVAVAMLVGSCATNAKRLQEGVITGHAEESGGPFPGRTVGVAVTVIAVRTDGPVFVNGTGTGISGYAATLPPGPRVTVRADGDGAFVLHVPPGRYTLAASTTGTATTSTPDCFGRNLPVVVDKGQTKTDDIICPVK